MTIFNFQCYLVLCQIYGDIIFNLIWFIIVILQILTMHVHRDLIFAGLDFKFFFKIITFVISKCLKLLQNYVF